jgi:hypothetical protein
MMAVGHKEHQRLANYDPEEEEIARIKEKERGGGYNPFNPFST